MNPEESISFHILENALDHILSAAENAKLKSARSWKYAILHLVAGIELLLKARLQNEHWSLLFQKVDQASETDLQSCNFVSVDVETAEIMDEMRQEGITPSHFFMRAAKELRDLRYGFPIAVGETYEDESEE